MRRIFPLLATLTLLAACADGARELNKPVTPIGDFKMGHGIVIAPNIVQGPASRAATDEEWIAAVDAAIEERFRRYEGDKFYHLGISIEGFVLAQPGIPLVFSPKSVLIVNVTVFDDATGEKLNEEAKQLTALEAPAADTFVVGSGLAQSRDEQMENLSKNIALSIEIWMRKQQREAGWFGGPDAGVPLASAPDEAAPADAEDGTEIAADPAPEDGTDTPVTVMAAEVEPELSAPVE